mmetsp:Transcript_45538/g.105569  ORF Transcript_45538/g.105569 Transcript_45538/m.105569 type:complete len:925 (+) Transcript_45538:75-2849(+)
MPPKAETVQAPSVEEPAAKRPKVDGGEDAAMDDSTQAAGGMKPSTAVWGKQSVKEESEQDAPALDKKAKKIKGPLAFHTEDTTMNVMVSTTGNVLRCLTDSGFRHYLGGARASRGLKAGRYMFEVSIVELLSAQDEGQRDPQPRRTVRIGFSTAGSSPIVGETEESVGFDSEGFYWQSGQKHPQGYNLGRLEVMAIVLNLDLASPNANTVSLFRNGHRLSNPQPLPEQLLGKTLFPTVTFRNATLACNFGPVPTEPLPFTCHMLSDALEKDAVTQEHSSPKDGKYEVKIPVCVPDEGVFDWADSFLAKNPSFTEISSRAISRWGEISGVKKSNTSFQLKTASCMDELETGSGLPQIDNGSLGRALEALIPVQKRNFLLIRVKAALLKEDREGLLERIAGSHKISAHVMVADPPKELRQYMQDACLKEKRDSAEAEYRAKKDAEERKRKLEQLQKQKELEKKKLEDARKKALAAASGAEEPTEGVEAQDEEMKGDGEAANDENAEEDGGPPEVQLTEEEKAATFRKLPMADLLPAVMSKVFKSFTLPEKNEGFDAVTFDWANQKKSEEYLKTWVADRKVTIRMDHIAPGQWFQERQNEWKKANQQWQQKQNEAKNARAKKEAEKQAKIAAKMEKWAAATVQARKQDLDKQLAEQHKQERAELGVTGMPENQVEETAEVPVEDAEMNDGDEESAADARELKFDNLDIFGVDDVLDIGTGDPLFRCFLFEDWTMMSLRFELHLLLHSFQRDVNDPEYQGIYADHLAFYYNKYYKKVLNMKLFGVDTLAELLALVQDTVMIPRGSKVIVPLLPEEIENLGLFVMLTEQARRERQRLVDLGDPSAKLNISEPAKITPGPTSQTSQADAGWGSGWGGGKGWGGDSWGGFGPSWAQGVPAWMQGMAAAGWQKGAKGMHKGAKAPLTPGLTQ